MDTTCRIAALRRLVYSVHRGTGIGTEVTLNDRLAEIGQHFCELILRD